MWAIHTQLSPQTREKFINFTSFTTKFILLQNNHYQKKKIHYSSSMKHYLYIHYEHYLYSMKYYLYIMNIIYTLWTLFIQYENKWESLTFSFSV